MKSRREILQASFGSLLLTAFGSCEANENVDIETLYRGDLPPVNLDGWQATVSELTFPAGVSSPKHTHPGFVLGYVLEGQFRFQIEGDPEKVLSTGEVFFEPPGAVHLPSGSASATKPAKVLALAFSQKGKELTSLL